MTNYFIRRVLDRQYDNCVSLGWFCGTASSLSKLGLRSHSGPFDWYFSHLWAVISQIDNGFRDFMVKENLEIVDKDVKVFRDIKYGFHCNHDVQSSFEEEYSIIYERYMRRANTFMKMIKHPTVFFRCIRDDDEIKYINDNWEYIEKLLKSFNSNNQIVYVCHSGIKGLTDKVSVFELNIDRYIGKTYEMRHMFDNSEELLDYCASLLSIDQMQSNVAFDNMMNSQKLVAEYVNKCVEENIDDIDTVILDSLNTKSEDGIFLWGAGKYGIALARYLSDRNVVIRGIIDNKGAGETRGDFLIQSPDAIPNEANIFIAVADKEANDSIVKQIKNMGIKTNVI